MYADDIVLIVDNKEDLQGPINIFGNEGGDEVSINEDSSRTRSDTALQIDTDSTPSEISRDRYDEFVPSSLKSLGTKRHRISSSDSKAPSRDRSPLRTSMWPRKPRASERREFDFPLIERRYHAQTVFCGRIRYLSHASFLPGHLRDFMWRLGWGVLPTLDHLERRRMVQSSTCPNCSLRETNQHVLRQCAVARVFWRAVHAGFRGLGVNRFVSSERCSRGRFACLLVVAGAYCFWRNRCEAVAAGRHRRALFPILERLYKEILSVLSEKLFFLGEEEFLQHWSCRFAFVCERRVRLLFRPAWYW
ncbi:uncharacterized protein LOC142766024 [Rhipicephalus microplus]|uniref:uncharacterized protein LOC142766024 n=1 Tax=Rhipicephalus microplus TaxID=6941 RepID=UPI003F6AF4AA